MPSFKVSLYVARLDDEVVATAFVGLPMMENTHTGHVHVRVARDQRRRGHGGAVARYLLDQLREEGRTQANWHTGSPLEGRSPGEFMSEGLGATPALRSIRRELRLAELRRDALEGQLTALLGAAEGYELRAWQGPCPDELLDGAAEILPRVLTDSPRGDLDMDDEVWDGARYREYESMIAARRRTSLATVALERPTGRLVAYTELNVPDLDSRVVAQQGTVVLPEHRGRRLGLTVKLANTLALLDAYPQAETVQTSNASENEHMIAVNEALGFRPAERSTIWQLKLSPPA